jgi:hypothetical protein
LQSAVNHLALLSFEGDKKKMNRYKLMVIIEFNNIKICLLSAKQFSRQSRHWTWDFSQSLIL